MPIRVRIALFAAVSSAAAVLVFGLLIYGLTALGLQAQRDQVLSRRAHQAATELFGSGQLPPLAQAPAAPIDLGGSADAFVEVLTPAAAAVYSTGTIGGVAPSVPAPLLARAAAAGHALATLPAQHGVSLRVYALPLRRGDTPPAGYLVAGRATRAEQTALRGLRNYLFISAVFTLLAALAGTWLGAGGALRPLKVIAHAVEEVGATGDLSRRLPASGHRDEVGQLGDSFNTMLARLAVAQDSLRETNARLATALEAQQRFVADASHELRTPLTSIRNNAGFLLGRLDALAADRTAALEDIAAESERMSRLVHDLLTLARADAGQHLVLAPVDLAETVREVARQAVGLYPHRPLAVEAPAAALVAGNADALRQLLWILLDNAARHTPEGGRIELRLERSPGGGVRLAVLDAGDGIPAAVLPHLFDRFYQADPARSTAGAGLGLAIARWIVAEHAGDLQAANRPEGGAEFSAVFPAA